jgi:hypothetical protein
LPAVKFNQNTDKILIMKERECLLGIAVGKRGVGKTWETMRMIDRYVKGNPKTGVPPRRALVYDVNNEYPYPTISEKDIKKFSVHPKIEVRRVNVYKPDGQNKSIKEVADTLGVILETFKGGLLVVEDVNKYVNDNLPADLIGKLCTLRHVDVDVIMHFQGIGRAGNPKILSYMNWLRFHKTNDTVNRHKTKFEDQYDILKLAENVINNVYEKKERKYVDKNGVIRYFCYVDFDKNKIMGNITTEMAQEAIIDHIAENKNEIIRPFINKLDPKTGKKVHDEKSALIAAKKTLFDKYF